MRGCSGRARGDTRRTPVPHDQRRSPATSEGSRVLAKLTALKMRMLTNAEIAEHPDQDPAAAREQQHALGGGDSSASWAPRSNPPLYDEAPMIGSGSGDQTGWVLRMLGYDVQGSLSPDEMQSR